MNEKGLFSKPIFSNPGYYLTSGERTKVTPVIENLASRVSGKSEEEVAKDLLVKMNLATKRLKEAGNDKRKFKRSAEEILISGERTGCTDSSTLFTALCRSRGIPAMQIVTLMVPNAIENPDSFSDGHFFTACFLKNEKEIGQWKFVDSDSGKTTIDDITFHKLNLNDRNITKRFYAFAYSRDYSEIENDGVRIDSIHNMLELQRKAFKLCDKDDLYINRNKSR